MAFAPYLVIALAPTRRGVAGEGVAVPVGLPVARFALRSSPGGPSRRAGLSSALVEPAAAAHRRRPSCAAVARRRAHDDRMSGPGLGRFQAVLSSLRAAAFSGPASSTSGRLQLTITQPADEGGEAQSLLRSGSSLGGGVGSPRGAAAGAPPDAGLQQQQGQQAHDAGGDADADLVAAAEQHRLTSLQSSVDLRAVALGLERGLPYVTLLMFLFISLHVVVGARLQGEDSRAAEGWQRAAAAVPCVGALSLPTPCRASRWT